MIEAMHIVEVLPDGSVAELIVPIPFGLGEVLLASPPVLERLMLLLGEGDPEHLA